MRALAALVLLSCLIGCSPYSGQIRNLDRAYYAGQIPPQSYFPMRQELAIADTQWRQQAAQQFAAGVAAGAQSYNQTYQNQQWINAYNNRTNMLAYPQTVNMNVEHSGTVYLRR